MLKAQAWKLKQTITKKQGNVKNLKRSFCSGLEKDTFVGYQEMVKTLCLMFEPLQQVFLHWALAHWEGSEEKEKKRLTEYSFSFSHKTFMFANVLQQFIKETCLSIIFLHLCLVDYHIFWSRLNLKQEIEITLWKLKI